MFRNALALERDVQHPGLLLYAFFWVIPMRLNFIRQRIGTLCLFHFHRQVGMKNNNPSYYSSDLPTYEGGTDSVFQNVGIQNSDAWESPRRKHTTISEECLP